MRLLIEPKMFVIYTDNMKAYREAEKEEILETEMNHNFEADMYLEKLEHENEKVNRILIEHLQIQFLTFFQLFWAENREIGQQRHIGHIFSTTTCGRTHSSEQSAKHMERVQETESAEQLDSADFNNQWHNEFQSDVMATDSMLSRCEISTKR